MNSKMGMDFLFYFFSKHISRLHIAFLPFVGIPLMDQFKDGTGFPVTEHLIVTVSSSDVFTSSGLTFQIGGAGSVKQTKQKVNFFGDIYIFLIPDKLFYVESSKSGKM